MLILGNTSPTGTTLLLVVLHIVYLQGYGELWNARITSRVATHCKVQDHEEPEKTMVTLIKDINLTKCYWKTLSFSRPLSIHVRNEPETRLVQAISNNTSHESGKRGLKCSYNYAMYISCFFHPLPLQTRQKHSPWIFLKKNVKPETRHFLSLVNGLGHVVRTGSATDKSSLRRVCRSTWIKM